MIALARKYVFTLATAGSLLAYPMLVAGNSGNKGMVRINRSGSKQEKLVPVAASNWGGVGIRLEIKKTGGELEFDCATGMITNQLRIDKGGNFIANGTFLRRGPGPIRLGFSPKAQAVRYQGKITGRIMKVTAIAADTDEIIGEFTLRRGKEPSIRRCL